MRAWTRALRLAVVGSAILVSTASAAPNDPLLGQEVNLGQLHVAQAVGRALRPLRPTIVAIFDSGVSQSNPDLTAALWTNPTATTSPRFPDTGATRPVAAGTIHGWDLIGTDRAPYPAPGQAPFSDPNPDDDGVFGGHGTFVAGIAGAATNNGLGVAGIAPNARIMAMRACWEADSAGNESPDQCYQYYVEPGFTWAGQQGARVINMSWDNGSVASEIDQAFRDAIESAPHTLFVAVASNGAGNYDQGNTDGAYPCKLKTDDPAAFPNLICTTALDTSGNLCGHVGASVVDIAAVAGGETTAIGNAFGPFGCSTSAAGPTVAGVAAILFGLDPSATPAQVRAAIIAGARKLPALRGLVAAGGELDALGAVGALQAELFTPRLAKPSVTHLSATSVRISGTVDTRGLHTLKVRATIASPGRRVTQTAAVVLGRGGRYSLKLRGLKRRSHIRVTVIAFADGVGDPTHGYTPIADAIEARRTITIRT